MILVVRMANEVFAVHQAHELMLEVATAVPDSSFIYIASIDCDDRGRDPAPSDAHTDERYG